MNKTKKIQEIINSEDKKELRSFFSFNKDEPVEYIVLKFNLWARKYFSKFFSSQDAPFHKDVDEKNVRVYTGRIKEFLDIIFRGGSKTTRTKLFCAFCIANDSDHFRKYIKILSKDLSNSTQSVTDIYNMLVNPHIKSLYPELWVKSDSKREETMSSFTTATGVKILASSVGKSQRGAVQDESRPDLIIYDDIEDRTTLRSAVITQAIWDNMEEAKNSLAVDGGSLYLANYISEQGNIHKLVNRVDQQVIIPIEEDGKPTWEDRYGIDVIKELRNSADDYEGEYLCKPNASKDIYFDREMLDKMEVRTPIRNIAGFKIYKEYIASHRYGGGMDVAGGVGLDSSTSCFIDFSTVPAQVGATFISNTISPEAFGDEIYSEANIFGNCIVAPENNKFDQTILKAKLLGSNIHRFPKARTSRTISMSNPTMIEGWNTNSLTKSKMLSDLRSAINDGLISLNDIDLINEAKSYTRNDLIDREPDARLSTRHFDLLIACAIAWQLKDYAESNGDTKTFYSGWDAEEITVNPAE